MDSGIENDRLAEKRAKLRALMAAKGQASKGQASKGQASTTQPQDGPSSEPAIVPDPSRAMEPFPLTDIQQAYWIGQTPGLPLGGVAAHMYYEYDAEPLDLARMEESIDGLVRRHPMMRVIIEPTGQQRVLEDPGAYAVPHTVARDDAEAEAITLALREEMSHQVRDGSTWPTFDFRATTLPSGRMRVHISFNLLIFDAVSVGMVLAEWDLRYRNPGIALPPLELTYRDYALADLDSDAAARTAQAYWGARAETMPLAPGLPIRPDMPSPPRFRRCHHRISKDRWDRLKARFRGMNVTPSGGLAAVYAKVLGAWSETPSFLINVTTFARRNVHPDVNRVIGDFTSLTLLEVDTAPLEGVGALARRVQKQLYRDIAHREGGGVALIREIMRKRGVAPSHVAPVVFTSLLAHDIHNLLNSLLGEPVWGISQTPQVWLDLQVFEAGGALGINWDFVDGLFEDGVPEAMFDGLIATLEALTDEDATPLDDPWLDPRPAKQVARHADLNESVVPITPQRLERAFVDRASDAPERLAIASPDRALSYAEVEAEVSARAASLTDLRLVTCTRVILEVADPVDQILWALAVLRAGCVFVPVAPDWPDDRRRAIFDAAGPSALIRDDGVTVHRPANAIGSADLAYIIFTSGSTGVPKGVSIRHTAAWNTIADMNRRFGVTAEDAVFAVSPYTFDLAIYDFFGPAEVGAKIVLPDRTRGPDPEHWRARMVSEGVTVWNSAPVLMDLFIGHLERNPDAARPPLRSVWLSGDWIPVVLPERIRAVFPDCEVISLGGATEASIWSIHHRCVPEDRHGRSIPYGRPLANQTWHVLDDALRPRPDLATGELFIGGEGLADGYWLAHDLTEASFITHPRTDERLFRTGDLGRHLPSGEIEILGRRDFQVKVNGYRVELGEIETRLQREPGIVTARALAWRGEQAGSDRLVAYIVTSGQVASEAEMRGRLGESLPDYMVPARIIPVDDLPATANGKLDRDRLPDPFATPPPAAPRAAVTDTDALKSELAGLFAETLSLPVPEVDQNLFDLGATSVDIVRLAGEIETRYGVRPDFTAFLADPTVATVAREIAGAAPAETTAQSTARPRPQQVIDPAARAALKDERHGLRDLDQGLPEHGLLRDVVDGWRDRADLRRSTRDYAIGEITFEDLSALLAPLCEHQIRGAEKRLYGSAGGLYPVQTYLVLKDGAITGMAAGAYYLDPVGTRLVRLGEADALTEHAHDPFNNRPTYRRARFSVFFVMAPFAIERLYADEAARLAAIEAGAMGHIIEVEAANLGVGLCGIGWMENAAVSEVLRLDPDQTVLYSMLGGALRTDDTEEGEL